MPRGQTKHLADAGYQYKAIWTCQPTAAYKFPVALRSGLLAIAQWADRQENPEEALIQLLELVKQK